LVETPETGELLKALEIGTEDELAADTGETTVSPDGPEDEVTEARLDGG